jgi:hypothetical protein
MNNGKWLYEDLNQDIWNTCEERYETKEDAIKAGTEYYKQLKHDEIYIPNSFNVGQIDSVNIYVDADGVIDQVTNSVYDEVGEVSEGWLYHVSHDSLDELGEKLTEVFEQWLEDRGDKPSFFKVINIEKIIL